MIIILYAEVSERAPISIEAWESMDETDRRRAFQIASTLDRKRFVSARYLLRQALSQVLDEGMSSFAFLPDGNGKPLLLNGPARTSEGRLDFSISHSAHAVAAAVSTEGRVGLDLELFQHLDPDQISVAFSPAELEKISALSSTEREKFCIESWSAKEAAAKLLGCPEQLDITSLPHVQGAVTDTYALKSWTLDFGPENYQLCLAYDGSAKTEILLRKETA